MNTTLYTSYFTPNYRQHAERLKASLDKFELDHHIVELPDTSDWKRNTFQKVDHIFQIAREITDDRPIVWLDADAEVVAMPDLLEQFIPPTGDKHVFAAVMDFQWRRKCKVEMLSGTMFFGSPETAMDIMRYAKSVIELHPDKYRGDQEYIRDEVYGFEAVDALVIHNLPWSYCQIIDAPIQIGHTPVILQHQASRKMRRGRNNGM